MYSTAKHTVNAAARQLRSMIQSLEAHENWEDYSFRQMTTLYYVTSYVYYVKDQEVMPDWVYEELCKKLLHMIDQDDWYIWNHVDRPSLEAGSGYALTYSMMIQNIAEALILGGV